MYGFQTNIETIISLELMNVSLFILTKGVCFHRFESVRAGSLPYFGCLTLQTDPSLGQAVLCWLSWTFVWAPWEHHILCIGFSKLSKLDRWYLGRWWAVRYWLVSKGQRAPLINQTLFLGQEEIDYILLWQTLVSCHEEVAWVSQVSNLPFPPMLCEYSTQYLFKCLNAAVSALPCIKWC